MFWLDLRESGNEVCNHSGGVVVNNLNIFKKSSVQKPPGNEINFSPFRQNPKPG